MIPLLAACSASSARMSMLFLRLRLRVRLFFTADFIRTWIPRRISALIQYLCCCFFSPITP